MTADTGDDIDDEGPGGESDGDALEGEPVASGAGGGGEGRAANVDRVDDLEAEIDALRRDLSAVEAEVDPEEVEDLRSDLDALETRIDERTVDKSDFEEELRRYVRKRQRRGHATGWGPYLVLLYGTAMTVGAFYYLGDWAAIAAMFVIWLSTLGLYVVLVLFSTALAAGRKLGGLRDLIGRVRS